VHRHPLDFLSLVAGLLFTGFAVAYLVGAYTDVRLDPRLVLPLALVALGIAGLGGSLLAQRRSDRRAAVDGDGAEQTD
jgi:hypothetical protein